MVGESIQRLRFFFRALTHRKLDALDLLEKDHIRVEMLFFRWRFTSERKQREHIFERIHRDLIFHAHLEEAVFYPACLHVPELKDIIYESIEEHKQMKTLLKEISRHSVTSERAIAKMKVLMEDVERHVTEEENDLFPRVRTYMKEPQLNKLSRELRVAHDQFDRRNERKRPRIAA